MAEMTDNELARLIQLSEPDVKVLYFTGFADRLFKEKITLWDPEAFIDKPCSIKGLVEAVSMILFGRTTSCRRFLNGEHFTSSGQSRAHACASPNLTAH